MSHTIFTTQAFVLDDFARGEADTLYVLYTREFGKILALATGIRKPESKIRGHMCKYSLANISLVRGREYWKITSAETSTLSCATIIEQALLSLSHPLKQTHIHILNTVKRMYGGEKAEDQYIFDDLISGLDRLWNKSDNYDPHTTQAVEIVVLIRLLSTLGYVEHQNIQPILTPWSDITSETLSQVYQSKTTYIKIINKALEESHL